MTYNPKASRSTLAAASALLARHLRHGPLETLDELRAGAKDLAATIEADERDYLWELVELVRIAHKAMAEFHEFTHELTTLVDKVARAGGSTAAARNERCRDAIDSASRLAEPARPLELADVGRTTK